MSYSGYDSTILQWAVNRHLLHADGTAQRTTPLAQAGKTLEELTEAEAELAKREISAFAVELGDILFTLEVQALMHGASLSDCVLAVDGTADMCWERVRFYFDEFRTAVAQNLPDLPKRIGALILCVEDGARFYCQKTGAECLDMAVIKNQNRTGTVVNGVFVKDIDRGSGR